MDITISKYSAKLRDHKCNGCGGRIPTGDDMLNIVLNEYTSDGDECCNVEHDIYLCHTCAKDVFLDVEVISFLIGGP